MSGVTVNNLVHTYQTSEREVRAVDEISFQIQEGEFYTLLGPSGCGKTTTLRCIAGLEDPDSGEIILDGLPIVHNGKSLPTHRRPIGMVFQDYAVWPHMTAFENVAFPLEVAGKKKSVIRNSVMETLALVGMADFATRRTTQLSGGQQQRLSLARALVRGPKILLLDEPLSNLDAKLRDQMRFELRELQRKIKVTTLFVTHDQVEALAMSTHIAVMNKGRIVQEGTPRDIYLTPTNRFVAEFVGAATFIDGEVASVPDEGGQVTLSTELGELVGSTAGRELAVGAAVTMVVRPESVTVVDVGTSTAGTNRIGAAIEMGQFVGDSVQLAIIAGDQRFTAKGSAYRQYKRGERVDLVISPYECVVIER